MKISSEAKTFLSTHSNLLKSGDIKSLYNKIVEGYITKNYNYLISEVSQILINSGVNPLDYLNDVPQNFLFDSDVTSIKIPSNITKISMHSFAYSNVESIKIPNSVDFMGINAFQECKKLKSITFSNALKTIPKNICLDCTSLSYVGIPEGVEEIMRGAFFGCDRLNNVTIPKSIKFIEVTAFPDNLKELTYSGTIAEFRKIAMGSFYATDHLVRALDNVVIHCTDGDMKN